MWQGVTGSICHGSESKVNQTINIMFSLSTVLSKISFRTFFDLHYFLSGDIFTLNETNIIATLLKFTGYIHNHKILPWNIFGLILKKTRWPPQAFFQLSARTVVGPLEQRVLQVEISNSQDMLPITKSLLKIFLASF